MMARTTKSQRLAALAALQLLLGACVATTQDNSLDLGGSGLASPVTPEIQRPADLAYFRSDQPFRLGVEHFNRGNFGLSERYFRDAVERTPKDAAAWIGLGASYDRIGRFDRADEAYAKARKLSGESVELLNNLGFSNMLRGKFGLAHAYFSRAAALQPDNPTIANNLRLLEQSTKFVVRAGAPG
jgi:Flp pilus assembly protein TadD